MSPTPSQLTNCDKLQAEPAHECTRFNRFVLIQPKPAPRGDKPKIPVATLPTGYKFRDRARLEAIEKRSRQLMKDLKVRFPVTGPDPAPVGSGARRIVRRSIAGLGLVEGEINAALRVRALRALRPAAINVMASGVPRMGGMPGFSLDLNDLLAPVLKGVRDFASTATEAKSRALWAIGLEFEQCWLSEGYLRGRLVRSLPLTPGEQLEVVIKTWDKHTERKSQVEAIARNISTEVTGEEKWMLASKMAFSDQASASVSPTAGVNGGLSIPIETVTANVAGNLGLSGNLSDQLSQSTAGSMDFIHTSTMKAAQSLQATRTNSVEMSHESGEEATRKQVIANTNRCHTLTYHYFEIAERFTVTTRFRGARVYLLIPLPVPDITPEWLLCNECYLRKVLPCETYYAGFDGAKTLLEWRKLTELFPAAAVPPMVAMNPAEGKSGETYQSPFADAVEAVLERWRVLKEAQLLAFAGDAGAVDELLAAIAEGGQAVMDGLTKLGEEAKNGVDDAIEAGADMIDKGIDAIGNGLQAASEAAGDLAGLVRFSSAPRLDVTGSRTEGGPGTWLYREVAAIAAPQIADAMTFLEAAWPEAHGTSVSNPVMAELNVLQTFFTKLGMPSFTFGKVDALFVAAAATAVGAGGLAGGVVGAAGGAAAGAAIAVWGFGVSAIPGALIGGAAGSAAGAAVGAGLVAAALAVIASLEAFGFADTVPDDEGLKAATENLKARFDSALSVAPAGGLLNPSGTGAEQGVSAQDRWREQMEQLASARVEYERLACHVRGRLTYYMQGLWSRWTDYEILIQVRRHGIPEHVVAPRFEGFHGHYGALPVTDVDWLSKDGGLDWVKTADDLAKAAERQKRSETITLPTPGMTVEPALGMCDACEPFIEQHRTLDLENRRAEVDIQKARALQEEHEADRFKQRLAQGELEDPTPFEGADVTVEMEKP